MSLIYCITNRINNKKYIGQTINSADFRLRKHISCINCKNICSALYSAIKKYGKENFFIKEIISGEFSKEELNILEEKYIKEYNTISPYGYNLQTGGGSFRVSEEVKAKMKVKMKGRKITWGDKVSESMKKKWKDPEYRKTQILQRHEKRGKYKEGIVKEKLRVKIDEEEFTNDYKDGMKLKELKTKYNISVPTIYRIIKTNNICKRRD